MKAIIFCIFIVFNCMSYSTTLYGQSRIYTTDSKQCGSCSEAVSIDSKIGMKCPHCGVRWGYENEINTIESEKKSVKVQEKSQVEKEKDFFEYLANKKTEELPKGVNSIFKPGGTGETRPDIPKYYERAAKEMGWTPFDRPENLDKAAYANQNRWDIMKSLLAGGFNNFLAGIGMGLSFDFNGIINNFSGNIQVAYGNKLSRLMGEYRVWNHNANPIYQSGNGAWNGAYLSNQVKNGMFLIGIVAFLAAIYRVLLMITRMIGRKEILK